MEQLNDPYYVYNYMQQNQTNPYGYQGPVGFENCPKCNSGCSTEIWDNTFGNALSDQSKRDGEFGALMLKIYTHTMYH